MGSIGRVGYTIHERAVMLDTCSLVSLYDPGDDRGEVISVMLEQMKERKYPVYITLLTIAETHNRILQHVGYERALGFLKAITDGSVHILEIQETDITDAIGFIEKYSDKQISCTDALSAAVMRRMRIQHVLSYDRHFRDLGFFIIPEVYQLLGF